MKISLLNSIIFLIKLKTHLAIMLAQVAANPKEILAVQ
jgi:hypothetical protein